MLNFIMTHTWIIMAVLVWSLPWKGAALWKSARKAHLGWFIILIIINTLGILEILYIFVFSEWGNKKVEESPSEPGQVRRNNPRIIM